MSDSTGVGVTAGSYSFAINGVTNTSELGTFYARLITYTGHRFALNARCPRFIRITEVLRSQYRLRNSG